MIFQEHSLSLLSIDLGFFPLDSIEISRRLATLFERLLGLKRMYVIGRQVDVRAHLTVHSKFASMINSTQTSFGLT